MDLLTVLMHEMGHVLGLGDLSSTEDIMNGSLAQGVRLAPTPGDQSFDSLQISEESAPKTIITLTMDDQGQETTLSHSMEQSQKPWLIDFLLNWGEEQSDPNGGIVIVI
jgi:hypothetical protein